MEEPEEFKELIGTTQLMGGGLFGRKQMPTEEYKVIDWRWGSALVMCMKTFEMKHPTVELLVKKDGMKASRWTSGFPCRSINLKDEE